MTTYIDPRSLSYTADERKLGAGINLYGNKTQVVGKQSQYAGVTQAQRQAAKRAKLLANRQIQAEVGDDFTSLASKLGIDATDFANANKDTFSTKPGAFYNVPNFREADAAMSARDAEDARIALSNAQYDVNTYDSVNEIPGVLPSPTLAPDQPFSFKDFLPDPNTPEESYNAVQKVLDWFGNFDFYNKDNEGSYTPGGGKTLASPAYVDPRSNRGGDRAAYDTTGPKNLLEAEIASGLYNDEFLRDEGPQRIGEEYIDPRGNRPSDRDAYFGDELAKLKYDWENTYLDPDNKGRGGGIPGWIEERTGMVGIDPWNMSDEEFEIFLSSFDTEELNYLESHGFIVPQGVYVGGGVPAYGSGGTSRGGGGTYPTGYGGYSSQTPSYAQRQSYIGLTSWSI
ncbi:MAG: hypothetical protein KAH23_10170 [Kiritimatiellae bacterium]|nr:hypothetical protein [Kiritimatiellia bacterium]